MASYRLLAHGSRLLVSVTGKPELMSFYTTVFIDAGTPEEALDVARKRLWARIASRLVGAADLGQIQFEEIEELGLDAPREQKEPGLAWYRDESSGGS